MKYEQIIKYTCKIVYFIMIIIPFVRKTKIKLTLNNWLKKDKEKSSEKKYFLFKFGCKK